MKYKGSYISYIKKLFIKNFISVILIISCLYIFSLYFAYQVIVVKENQKANMLWSETMEEDLQAYQYELLNIAASEPVKEAVLTENALWIAYDLLYTFRNNRLLKGNFALVNNEGTLIATNLYTENVEEFQGNMLMKIINDIEEPKTIHRRFDYQLFQHGQESSYYFATPVMDKQEDVLGYLFYFIEDSIEQFDQISDFTVLTDSFDNIIFTSDSSLVSPNGKFIANKHQNKKVIEIAGQRYYMSHKTLLDKNFTTYNLMSVNIFQQMAVSGIAYFLGIIVIVNVIIYLAGPKVMKKSVQSFKGLLHFIDHPETKKEEQNFEEFQLVEEAFAKKIQEIEELNKVNQRIQEVKRKLEIKQLESQFNPHFAFNVLEMLRYEIAFDPENADRIIVSFANLMRYSTYYDEIEIALETDLKYVEDYLKLQKMRFDKRLDYEIEVEKGIDNVKVPKMVIQPLIENCIKHNIEVTGHLQLAIKIVQVDNCILLSVADDGMGIPPETLSDIGKVLDYDENPGAHYGLYHCQRIVQLLYGKEYGLRIDSKEGKGTTVTIYLPRVAIDL